MRIKRINGMFTVASQLEPLQVHKVADAGYKSIICNRPDDENGAQPLYCDVAAEAEKLGLVCRYIPVALTGETDADVAAFSEAIDALPKPILAYCRSGVRSATLWAKWEHVQAGMPETGERRTGTMRAGAMDGGGMSLSGKRPAPRQKTTGEVVSFPARGAPGIDQQ